jgi:hypothetical protein
MWTLTIITHNISTLYEDTQHKYIQHNDSQQYDSHHNGSQHKGNQHNDSVETIKIFKDSQKNDTSIMTLSKKILKMLI